MEVLYGKHNVFQRTASLQDIRICNSSMTITNNFVIWKEVANRIVRDSRQARCKSEQFLWERPRLLDTNSTRAVKLAARYETRDPLTSSSVL